MKRVLVLLAAYNGAKWINEQIESILYQANVDITLYISVDKSTDETARIVEEIGKKNYKNVFMLPYGKVYGSATANFFRLIREVDFNHYDYIGFSDQDDIWKSTKYENAIALMIETDSSGYSSNVEAFWSSGKKKLINKAQDQVRWDYLFESGGPGCTYLLDKKLAIMLQNYLLDKADIDNKIKHHDWFYYAFARAKGEKWIIDKRVTVLYRQHETNTEGANVGCKAIFNRVKGIIACDWINQSRAIIAIDPERHFKNNGKLDKTRKCWLFWAIHCCQCRRKQVDKFIFMNACLILALLGEKE